MVATVMGDRNDGVPELGAASGWAHGLIGRDREVARLAETLDEASAGPRSLLVVGEPGIGKSSLLSYAATRAWAAGMQVLTTTGVETEAHLPFAGLHQLLRPVADHVDGIAGRYRDALLSAFGLSNEQIPDVFLAGLATLELVCAVATSSPVLVIVDDVQWTDPATLGALAVMARRLGDDPIWFVAACRDGYHHPLRDVGIEELRVERLDDTASQLLLDRILPALDEVRRARILDISAGNPLALVELCRSIPELGAESVPVTRRIERAFAGRLSEIPATTRAIVLVAALDDGDAVIEVLDAASELIGESLTLAHLSPGVSTQLVIVEGPKITFPHPLVRSAVRQAASAEERVAAHAALAHVLRDQPDRAVWHRAAATLGTDDDLADDLHAAGQRARRRGAPTVAQAALERAADLTTDPLRRAGRLFDAAETAYELGRRDVVERILRTAEDLDRRPMSQARSMWIRERFDDGFSGGTVGVSALAQAALETRRLGDTELALNLLASAAIRCWWAHPGQREREAVLDAIQRIDVKADEPLYVASLAWAASIEREPELTEQLLSAKPVPDLDPAASRLLGAAAICLGDHPLAGRFLDTAVDGLRRDGRLAWLAQSLLLRAWNSIHLMHLDNALADAAEGERLARESGQQFWVARGQVAHAFVAGLRGDVALADKLAGDAERVAFPRAVSSIGADVQLARGITALSNRDYPRAFDQFHRMFDPTDPAFHPVKRCWSAGNFAEAAVRSGQRERAVEVIAELRVVLGATASPHIGAAMRHATAVLADDANADTQFRRALDDTPGAFPFDRARLQLAHGGWLRRRRRVAESRAPLRSALATFDALGAISWGQQARDELRASGETSRSRRPDALDRLTPQELQIARLAAEGLPNREIAQRLYLSPRTIGSHLYRIYPKLGVTSRSQLRAQLDELNLRHAG